MRAFKSSIVNTFCWVACGVVFFTAVAKIQALVSGAKLLVYSDPVFGVDNRLVLQGAVALEMATIVICAMSTKSVLRLTAIGAFGSIVIAYRLALVVVGFKGWCTCLGNYGQTLFEDPSVQSKWLMFLAVLLFVVPTAILTYSLFDVNKRRPRSEFSML